jgi:hypothetical protein
MVTIVQNQHLAQDVLSKIVLPFKITILAYAMNVLNTHAGE